MVQVNRLTGVYDADGGLRGEIAYLAGKLTGRHCSLCDITHSPVRRRRAWDSFVESLPIPFDVVHRNERDTAVAMASEGLEPCIVAHHDGIVTMLIDSESLEQIVDVTGLAAAIDDCLSARGWTLGLP